jgi:glycosyltransferase involved in cell wall biosynthesis
MLSAGGGALGPELSIAYVHYGWQSGVTSAVARALLDRGHDVRLVTATGVLEPRDPVTRRPRPRADILLHLALACARYGRRGLEHRWNTPYAFDRHAREAGLALRALRPAPQVVLQNGALFGPGDPPPFPYVLLLDHTRALAEASPAWGDAGVPPPLRYGSGWFARETALYRGAAALATFSQNAARSLVRDYGVDPDRVHVVGAGANVFPETAPRRDDGQTITFVGYDFVRKGGRVLLEAMAILRGRLPKARLLVAGAPTPDRVPPGVAFLGPMEPAELPPLFAQSTVFALPTLQEPFGLAFLDAMACGLPCVGTRVEAVPEIVREGDTGLLVPPGDPVALAAALERLLRDPTRARAMGARGRARVSASGLWTHAAARIERTLGAALGRRGRAA